METISTTKLCLLFDSSLFEVRPETQRDKGVDLIVELKQNGFYTNFRFVIQLKATGSIAPNKDGSISFPIGVSNINYLLNYGMPAYYILYEHKNCLFYLEHVNRVFSDLLKAYKPTKLPRNFTVNFSRHFTPEVIQEIYQQTLENGLILRKLSPHFTFRPDNLNYSRGVLIDSNNEVYSVEQNIEFINHFGFKLLGDGQFSQIVEIELCRKFQLLFFEELNFSRGIEILKK